MSCRRINNIESRLLGFKKATELLQLFFLASGIDGYEVFAEKTTLDDGLPLRKLVVDII
jgi:hypothetical protein